MEILDRKEAQCSHTSIDAPPGDPLRGLVISSAVPPTASQWACRSSHFRFVDNEEENPVVAEDK